MEVHVSHHVDASEPDADGLFAYRYEYDRFEFHFSDRVIWARRYAGDDPGHISIVGSLDKARRPKFGFYEAPNLAAEVVTELKGRGFTNIDVLTEDGYTPLDASRLKAVQ